LGNLEIAQQLIVKGQRDLSLLRQLLHAVVIENVTGRRADSSTPPAFSGPVEADRAGFSGFLVAAGNDLRDDAACCIQMSYRS
jgi:hypothetical protein